jgi:hypothetical protein
LKVLNFSQKNDWVLVLNFVFGYTYEQYGTSRELSNLFQELSSYKLKNEPRLITLESEKGKLSFDILDVVTIEIARKEKYE